MKQETLEEAANKYAVYNFDSYDLNIDDHFIEGAKLQAERMYSEEEVEIISNQRIHKYKPMNPHPMSFFIGFKDGIEYQQERSYSEEWFKKIKKK